MSLDLAAARRRNSLMLAFSLVAALASMAAIVGYFKFHQPWALAGFVVAALMGFGAQIWFIASLRRANKGA